MTDGTVDILVPPLSQTSDTLILVEWLKKPGDLVAKGEALFSVETDKATLDVEAPGSGILVGPLPLPGAEIKVRSVIGQIASSEGAAIQRSDLSSQGTARNSSQPVTSDKVMVPPGVSSIPAPQHSSRRIASPRARRLASEKGVDLALSGIQGSGPAKAIIEKDVLEFLNRSSGSPARTTASVPTAARVTLVIEADATQFVQAREQLKASVAESWGFAPGYNDLIALIVAHALKEFPFMNARLSSDGANIEWLSHINLGMAVDAERGLVVPVIRNADQKGLKAFGSEFRALVERARLGRSLPDDLAGGTFTITNLGMYDIDAFTPVINLPEIAILGLGRIAPKVVPIGDQPVIRQMWTLSLVFDHRLVDGAPAARFLQKIKQMVENPYLLLA